MSRICDEDTIAAISTPLGEGGIGIVRLSGERALEIVEQIFSSPKNVHLHSVKTHTIHYGFIKDNREMIDEVLVSVMRAPRTYTREDVVEINCHGGMVPLRKVLELVLQRGARYAEPGEFTKRAFLNGRLTVDQAEAVLDIIKAKSDLSLEMSMEHLAGRFSQPIKEMKERLLDVLAKIEVAIDFPDYEEDLPSGEALNKELSELSEKLNYFLARGVDRRIIREGLDVAIIGKPNVGKSTLLNALLQENRAIVTPIPGTTRDRIEEWLEIKGIPFKIADTAGLRRSTDEIERIGAQQTIDAVNKADLTLFMVDVSAPLTEEDSAIAEEIDGKRSLLLLNKMDLRRKFTVEKAAQALFANVENILEISAKYGTSLEELKDKMVGLIWEGRLEKRDGLFLLNIREKDLLKRAKNALEGALSAVERGVTMDLLAVNIKEALDVLGELTGENLTEEVIDRIFSNFCVGK